jgi:20S proteasome subunit beta 2
MYCCGAGTAADTEFTTNLISSKLELHQLTSGCEARVSTAMTMLKQYLFRHQGHIGAALILGGVDCTGSHLYTVYPHGSVDRLPYVTMGSGSLNAMAVFESRYRPGMEKQEAIELVAAAIRAGIFNDLGSGSNVDVTVITAEGAEIHRNYQNPNQRPPKQMTYSYPPGCTPILKETVKALAFEVVAEETKPTMMEE